MTRDLHYLKIFRTAKTSSMAYYLRVLTAQSKRKQNAKSGRVLHTKEFASEVKLKRAKLTTIANNLNYKTLCILGWSSPQVLA
jgi:hypothetical protein